MAQTALPPVSERGRSRAAPAPTREEQRLDVSERVYRRAVGAAVAGVATFLALRLTAWPPHEDETLALYVGNSSLRDLAGTVLGERGGAPLHYVAAWIVAHLGGGLGGLRVVSALFALVSIPLVAVLARRLTGDRMTAALAVVLASANWVLLFHGIYARMYSIFLCMSLLSYLGLLAALRHGGVRRWALWGAAVLLCVATHPYGALVLASQGLYVLLVRERLREAIAAGAAVVVVGTPFWITDLVLAGRFDVGVGGGGAKLGSPFDVAGYLGDVAADFSAGPVVLPVALALGAAGFVLLHRQSRRSALLVAAVVATPALAFLVARLGASASPETRHLIFALPFFATCVAVCLAAIARSGRPGSVGAAGAVAALLVLGGVGWAAQKTPLLFTGEPPEQRAGRAEAARWLAATGRSDDVLLGYEPVYLEAWERGGSLSRHVLPRADARLAAKGLRTAPQPLGRGVWVFDAQDTANPIRRLELPRRLPRPPRLFEARAFGPYLVVRTVDPVETPEAYVRMAAAVLVIGKTLGIGDADVNYATISRVADELYGERSSSSTSSR